MKKSLIAGLFALGMFAGLYADPAEDAQFQQYVKLTKESKSNPQGMTVCADPTYRIIYAAMPISLNKSDVTPEILGKMRKAMLTSFQAPSMNADRKIIKDLKISLVYTLITTDKKIFTISFSYQDL